MTALTAKLFPFLEESVFEKLRKSGYCSIIDIIDAESTLVARQSNVRLNDVIALRRAALRQQNVTVMNGDEFYAEMKQFSAVFSTGIENLDILLRGGVFSGEIIEFMGSSSSGKTQVCLSLASYTSVVARQRVLYVDTNGSFSSKRVKEIMKSHGVAENEMTTAFYRIVVCRCFSLRELFAILDEEDHPTVQPNRLIVVDSITALILPHFGSSDEEEHKGDIESALKTITGLGILNHLSMRLKSIAVRGHKAIVVTNSVIQWQNETPRPSLGRHWSYVPNVRVVLSESDDGLRETIATLEVSKTAEYGKTVKFKICTGSE